MSELFESLRDIKRLPIFPLPVALLPNEILPLHIFEQRYRDMLRDIRAGNNFFGLSYFNPEDSIAARPEIGSLGCLAEVREVQTLEDGRSNIVTVGIIRYEIEGYEESAAPYLVGEILIFEDYEEDENELKPIADTVYSLFNRIADAAYDLSGARTKLPKIPQAEPQMLSFLVSAAFNLQAEIKYEFMEMRSTIERLERLQDILTQAVGQIEESAKINKVARTNGHSKKKINLD